MYSSTETSATTASPMNQEKRRNRVLIEAGLARLPSPWESEGERLEDIKHTGVEGSLAIRHFIHVTIAQPGLER